MRRFGLIAMALGLLMTHGAFAQPPKLEKTRISLSVGGSISQMNKIAYFVALNRKYFQQEGLDVVSVAFAWHGGAAEPDRRQRGRGRRLVRAHVAHAGEGHRVDVHRGVRTLSGERAGGAQIAGREAQ